MYFEKLDTVEEAMRREKQLKKWNRNWKNDLINKLNPDWKDLSENSDKKLTDLEFLEMLFENKNNSLVELVPVTKGLKELFKAITVTIDNKDFSVSVM